jgi:predicted ATP-grasp superfamily ATP-dependent carboligase
MLDSESKIVRKLQRREPAAFILGDGRCHALAFARSLGRKGIPALILDTVKGIGVRSRYCFGLGGETLGDESELLDFLVRIGNRLPTKGVLIPAADAYLLLISRNRSLLSKYYEFVLTEGSTLERLANKQSQYQYAASIGLPVPKTYALERPHDIKKVAAIVHYPCIIKPVYSYPWARYRQSAGIKVWKKLAHVESPSELMQAYCRMAKSGVGLVVQERIEGGDDQLFALDTYFSRDSEPLAIFVRKKLRQWPANYGDGCHSMSTYQGEVVELGLKLLNGLNYRGLANIEFKKDPRDGQFKLMEINVRGSSHVGLAVDSGVDFPTIAYKDALREPLDLVDSYKEGVKWTDFGQDFGSFLHYHRTKQLGFWSWLRSVKETDSYAYFAWDDPLPFVFRGLQLLGGVSQLRPRL